MNRKSRMIGRTLTAVVAVGALGAISASPASAAAHWTNGSFESPHNRKTDLDLRGGLEAGSGEIRVDWDGTDVSIRGYAFDASPDNRGVLVRVSYDYYSGRAWHHASKKVAAKAAGAYKMTKFAKESTLPVRHLYAQACLYNSRGQTSWCGPVR
ncbi:hypothetical protein [Streptomyces sp. RTd22]|uniref:hypothetical protein n=1 Tax=Streptomyces sp. RTd22 TaxID=1841249 RepID=UPI0007C56840|nr:hypothetical protein [Streptomyces sp. RTd22]